MSINGSLLTWCFSVGEVRIQYHSYNPLSISFKKKNKEKTGDLKRLSEEGAAGLRPVPPRGGGAAVLRSAARGVEWGVGAGMQDADAVPCLAGSSSELWEQFEDRLMSEDPHNKKCELVFFMTSLFIFLVIF